MIMGLKQKRIEFKPRIKLNHNIHTLFDTVTEGAMCPIKLVQFRENERGFFTQGQTKLSVITRCPY